MSTSEIVERLRLGTANSLHPMCLNMQAAADRLDELQRENARMREALKPFIRATQMAEWNTYNRGDDPAPDSHMSVPSLGLTLGDLRRAALAGSGEK